MIESKKSNGIKDVDWSSVDGIDIYVKLANLFKNRKDPLSMEEICLELEKENSNRIK